MADLRRCRSLVRTLAYDLPAFDSVWLDALVQIGRLTPYQARLLESARPTDIRVGPFVVTQRVGGGTFGQTLLARPIDTDEQCIVKRLTATERLTPETIERLEALVARGRDVQHPSLVAPVSGFWAETSYLLVSRYVPGAHLGELLIRRGRFPAAVVWEIGRQLAEGLEALARQGLVHGDIRAANVRLTSGGVAVLTDAGVRPALDPTLTMHSGLTPERYDGIAPELVGVGGQHGVATDAYALGCLLWQLLAGRPPFPGGDPLIKLAAHQTRRVDDVRRWSPDVPAALAEGIARMTSRNPADRPASFAELLSFWGPAGRSGRQRLAAFRRRFDTPARSQATRRPLSTTTRWMFLFAMLFAVSGGVAALVSQGARSQLLNWTVSATQRLGADNSPAGQESEPAEHAAGAAAEATGNYLTLPPPDRHGLVQLDSAGPYLARELTAVGALSIVGDETVLPQIVVVGQPFKLCAESITLKNLQIVTRQPAGESPAGLRALLRTECQNLTVEKCSFVAGGWKGAAANSAAAQNFAPPSGPALIAWKLLDSGDQRGGVSTIRQSVFLGDGPALYLANAVRQVSYENVLKQGPGPLVQLAAAPAPKTTLNLKLNHATLRGAGAVMRWVVPGSGDLSSATAERKRGSIQIDVNDSVLDVASPQAALIELAGAQPKSDWLRWVRLTGESSITRPSLDVAAWVSTLDGSLTPLDSQFLEVEGVTACEFRFAGPVSERAVDAEVREADAPRRTAALPGIRASDLPR
ncbi:MAG: serine/threonine protein kinase [Planctomycetes bacterium]|nr:serine/threonine protein kinase [Planctomycetota bacterium]